MLSEAGRADGSAILEPLRAVWDALERADCDPHGVPHDFRARCPVHDGENREALHVSEGADRRVVLHCFAYQCEVERITAALGLGVADLFPPGHHKARRRHLQLARRSDFTGSAREVANVLAAVDTLAMPWVAMVTTECAYCGGTAWLRTTSEGRSRLDCSEGCSTEQFKRALAARIDDRRSA